jgi:hypothetical protein
MAKRERRTDNTMAKRERRTDNTMAKRERRTDNKNGEIAHMNEINVIIHK